jgi:hypothetical protein
VNGRVEKVILDVLIEVADVASHFLSRISMMQHGLRIAHGGAQDEPSMASARKE